MTRARGLAAPPPPYGRRLRCDTTPHHDISIRQTQPSTTTDAKWGHFKPSRRGQRKPSFSILRNRRVCLIAGPPGVGKTTVAHMLVADAIQRDFEPIEISGDIDEAWDIFDERASQIFLYDDFLGATVLDALHKNEAKRLTAFMRRVERSPTTHFVLTTREHILREAEAETEAFQRHGLQHDRYLMLNWPSEFDRARVLANHVWHSPSLDAEAKRSLARKHGYRRIIDHPNFSPRVVEYITGFQRGHRLEVHVGKSWLESAVWALDHPDELWRTAYRKLHPEAQTVLVALATFDGEIALSNLEKAWFALCATNRPARFVELLRVLVDSFVVLNEDGDLPFVRALNPGLLDFLHREALSDPVLIESAAQTAIFYEQVLVLWRLALTTGTDGALGAVFAESIRRTTTAPAITQRHSWQTAPTLEQRLNAIRTSSNALPDAEEIVSSFLPLLAENWRAGLVRSDEAVALARALPAHHPIRRVLADVLSHDPKSSSDWTHLYELSRAAPEAFEEAGLRSLGARFRPFLANELRELEARGQFTFELDDMTKTAEWLNVEVNPATVKNIRSAVEAREDEADGERLDERIRVAEREGPYEARRQADLDVLFRLP